MDDRLGEFEKWSGRERYEITVGNREFRKVIR